MKTFDPIIILGMHRSGTTMIADLLQKMGLYVGWVLQENSEALFFVERNERLMNVCGGSWEQPEPVLSLMNHPEMRREAADLLRRDIESAGFLSYLGPKHARKLGRIGKINFPWGWKDPRNSFLLPVWLDIFPNARLIHIHRHPLDVAASLQVRESRSVQRRIASFKLGALSSLGGKLTKPPTESVLLFLYRKLHSAGGRFNSLAKYHRFNVASTIDLRNGVDLWRSYTDQCLKSLAAVQNPQITVKYEDFLLSPGEPLEKLRAFCELPCDRSLVNSLASGLKVERRYAFTKNPAALELFEQVRNDPLLRRFGYDSV